MTKPLSGIRVFDLTLAGVGPWAAKMLGELGADVIHVDAPTREPGRVPPFYDGFSILYVTANYNKRGVVLDLKEPGDRDAAYRLLDTCDVFLANMRPGAVDRLGLGYEALAARNPRLVYCLASGYGERGPMVAEPGADPQMQAFAGWCSVTGRPGGPPEAFRHYAHLDFNTSQYIVQAILMALYARESTGRGQKIEIAMLGAAMALQSTRLAEFFATGATPPRLGSATVTTVPHQAFLCQDQRYLAVGVVREDQWGPLCRALGRDDLGADPRFATNAARVARRESLVPLLEQAFLTKPVRWWEIRLAKAGVPHGRFLSFDALRYHPQVTENGFIREMPTPRWGTLWVEGPPWNFSAADAIEVRPGPLPGEHTAEVMAEFRPPRRETTGVAVTAAGD